jgi:hypothetical protein
LNRAAAVSTSDRSNRVGEQPTPTPLLVRAPGEDIREAEPEAPLPRHHAPEVFRLSRSSRSSL